MKRLTNLLFLFLTLPGSWLSAQNPASYTVERSDQHRQIAGTNVWIVPPKGFRPDEKVPVGLYKDEFNLIAVEELAGAGYDYMYSIRRQLAEDFKEDAQAFQSERTFRINGLAACEIQFADPTPPRRGFHLLMIGNERFVVLVRVFFRAPATSVQAVTECLRSVFIQTDQYPDPLAKAGFSLDLAGSGYGLMQDQEGMYAFAPFGYTEADSVPAFLLVFRLDKSDIGAEPTLAKIHSESLNSALSENPPSGAAPQTTELIFRDLPALQATVDVLEKGRPARLFQMTVAHPDHYFIAVALVRRNLDSEMNRLKALIQTMNFR